MALLAAVKSRVGVRQVRPLNPVTINGKQSAAKLFNANIRVERAKGPPLSLES